MITKQEIKDVILTLDLGYTYLMSDYAKSAAEEETIKREGLEEVDKVVDELYGLISGGVGV